MILLRKLLFPFAILYGLITSIRNYLYDKGILKSYTFEIPVIAVGNLSVGGTGKTPQIEYLIRLLSSKYKVATLSRGYKRKSEGFVLATTDSNAESLGDEPFQYFKKFPQIQVAVDADRRNGIEQLLVQKDKPEIILLDDAYQHRKVKAGFYILLTAYDDLFFEDFMLPTGKLREPRSGAKRANSIIVTKCPQDLSEIEQENIKKRIGLKVPVYFSFIAYDDFIYNENESIAVNKIVTLSKVLVAGIAKPKPFLDYLKTEKDECLVFPDHHDFTEKDVNDLKIKSNDKIIITTEKDFVRLNDNIINKQLYYLPIKSKLISNQDDFNQLVLSYVVTQI